MKKLDVDKYGRCHKYLIERRGELELAIDDFKPRADAACWTATELLANGHVSGLEQTPNAFPYICVMEGNDVHNHISCVFVKAGDFTAEPETKDNLYEFSIRRTDQTSPYRVHESKYQILARDPFEAHTRLGQVYHRDEAYTLEVISWQQVR